MIEVSILKYYSNGTFSDPLEAQKEANRLSEKYPERRYDIIKNMRAGYQKFTVVQVKRYCEQWPEEKDLGLPPAPVSPPMHVYGGQAWDDYRHELKKRGAIIDKAIAPLKKKLSEKLNP